MPVHPLIFAPILKRRVWAGQRLAGLLGKPVSPGEMIGESWEIAHLPNDVSVVSRGPLRGRRLDQLVAEWGSDLLGHARLSDGVFPLLIKFLDAAENLSVQVHPDAATASVLGGDVRVKHEAWYVIAADAGSYIYHGLLPGVTPERFAAAVHDGSCAELLHRIPVRPGDCHYLPSGTVHALGGGVLVAEIQTPSDATFRLFDWNRTDPLTGKPRPLQVEAGLRCVHFGERPAPQPRSHVASFWTTVTRLVTCESFIVEKVRMVAGMEQEIPYAEPVVWIVLEGTGTVLYGPGEQALPFKPGDTVLLPAALQQGRVRLDVDAVWLEVTLPSPSDLADFERPVLEQPASHPGLVQLGVKRGPGV